MAPYNVRGGYSSSSSKTICQGQEEDVYRLFPPSAHRADCTSVLYSVRFFGLHVYQSHSVFSKIHDAHGLILFLGCFVSQGVTAAQSLKAPFRKSALFSTPISERLDEIDLPPED